MENYFSTASSLALGRPGEICIAASAVHIATLRDDPAIGALGSAQFLTVDAGVSLLASACDGVRVLVIEVAANQPASLSRIQSIRSVHPDLKIIPAIADSDIALVKTLVRQGIHDVADLPFAPTELTRQIFDALSDDLNQANAIPLAPLYAVARSVGGSGSTSAITHLAAALVRHDTSGRGVCIADFDIQSGEVAAYLGVATRVNLSDLLQAGDRLDDALITSTVQETRYGFSILAAPDAITPLDIVSLDQVTAILTSLRQQFGYVLVDLPANWSNWTLGVATSASNLFMITDSAIASLRQARRRIDLLESVGIDRKSMKAIANRTERRMFRSVGTDDIANALRVDVAASLDDEGSALRAAQDQGVLMHDTVGRNGYVKALEGLAERMIAGEL